MSHKQYEKLKKILISRVDEDPVLNRSIYSWLGCTCYLLKKWDEATGYLRTAISLYPRNHQASTYFACCLLHTNQYEKAIVKFDWVRLRSPKRLIDGYEWIWANACENICFYPEAIVAYQFIEQRGQYSRVHVISRLALLLAASPDELCRNGPEAVAYAKEACEITEWKDWVATSLLAAAYANEGDFAEAIKYAKITKDLAPTEEKETRQERIEMYQANIPYRLKDDYQLKDILSKFD